MRWPTHRRPSQSTHRLAPLVSRSSAFLAAASSVDASPKDVVGACASTHSGSRAEASALAEQLAQRAEAARLEAAAADAEAQRKQDDAERHAALLER
eukprot:975449-Pleurochrysis_carterae.AAC.4